MNSKNIFINSTVLFTLATLLQQNLHELGHFIAAIIFNAKDISLHHNFVDYSTIGLSQLQTIVIAAAGPLSSLFVGICFHFLCNFYNKRNMFFLFMVFMSAFGYINFGGYLMVSPFFPYGDTGFVFKELGIAMGYISFFAVLGVAFLFFILKILGRYFVQMATTDIIQNAEQRKFFIGALIKKPVLTGIIITSLLQLPVPSFLSLIYPICSPFAFFWVYGYLLNKPYAVNNASKNLKTIEKLHWPWIIALIAVIIANRFLVGGLYY
jgi:hypothetical protein